MMSKDESRPVPVAGEVAANKRCPRCNLINSLTDVTCKRCDTPLSHGTVHHAAYSEQEEMPLWVKVGIWGLGNRTAVLAFMWLSIALSIFLAVKGYLPGLLFLLAAAWYWGAARWVDQHEMW